MLWRGLSPEGALSASVIAEVAGDRFYWERLGFTAGQATLSTALALLVGLPAAYVFALIRFPGRGFFRALVTTPFVLPTIVVALAFKQLLGPEGWLNDLLAVFGLGPVRAVGTLWAILAAHVFYNVSIVIRLVSGVWANLDPRTEEAARLLGAGRVATFRRVTLPAPAAGGALRRRAGVHLYLHLLRRGADPRRPGLDTLEASIYRLATRLVQLPQAAILSFVQLATTLAALTLYSVFQRRRTAVFTLRPDRARPLRRTSAAERALLALVAAGLGVLIVAPLGALVHGALTVGADGGVTGANFSRLFEESGRVSFIEPLSAVRWSLSFAAGATVVAVVVGTARRRRSRAPAGGWVRWPMAR